jgi:hypothetical protein
VSSFHELRTPARIVIDRIITGTSLMLGKFGARHIVERMSVHTFKAVVDGLMLTSGLSLSYAAIR